MVEPRLKMLLRWREVVEKVVEAVHGIYPEAKIYLFGGAAENRLTVLSDIDVAIVFHKIPGSPGEILTKIWEELEKSGVEPHYPLDILVVSEEELARIRGMKVRLT